MLSERTDEEGPVARARRRLRATVAATARPDLRGSGRIPPPIRSGRHGVRSTQKQPCLTHRPPRRATARPRHHPHHRADLPVRPPRPAPHRARHGRRAARRARLARDPARAAEPRRRSAVDGRRRRRSGPPRSSCSASACSRPRSSPLRRWFVLTPGTHVEAAHAQHALRQAAGPAGRVPRPLAERTAAVARDERPRPDPPLARVRRRAARREHRRRCGRLRRAVLLQLDARRSSSSCARSRSGSTASSSRTSTRSSRAASQDQQGDLATAVEESVHGIRVLKAFGRGRYSLEKFTRQAEELRGTEIEKARAIAGIWLWLLLVPDVAFALCLLGGVWLAVDRPADRRPAVRVLRDGDRAALADRVDRVPALDDVRHPHRGRPPVRGARRGRTRSSIPSDPTHIAEPDGRLTFDDVHFRYQDSPADSSPTSSTASTSSSSPARRWRSSA